MKIYQFAIQMEVDQGDYYRKMTDMTDHVGVRQVFRYLAEAEENHIRILKSLKKEKILQVDMEDLSVSKSLFKTLKASPLPDTFPGDEARIYEMALGMEKDSYRFFQKKAAELKSDQAEKAFKVLAAEEDRHARFLENIIEYIYKPDWWVRNAAFNVSGEEIF